MLWSVYRPESIGCSFIGYESGRFSSSMLVEGEVTPSVRLSPNATNFVTDSAGATVTDTVKPQVAVRASASVAVQVTVLAPSGNAAPEAGEQETFTGAWPFCAVGTS